jgi:AAA15 family ATPase/GTPase
MITLYSHRSEIDQQRFFSNARRAGLRESIVSLLRQIDQNIITIEILYDENSRSSRARLTIEHSKLKFPPLSTFGDGIRRLFHIALRMSNVQNGILLIDEIESTIHTELLHYTFQWIVNCAREFNVQVFATTHSLEAVDALIDAADSASDLVLYRLEPTETKTRVVRHDWERLKRLRENLGQEVRW